MSCRHPFITSYLYFDQEACEQLVEKFKELTNSVEGYYVNFAGKSKIIYIHGVLKDYCDGTALLDLQEWLEDLDFKYSFDISISWESENWDTNFKYTSLDDTEETDG